MATYGAGGRGPLTPTEWDKVVIGGFVLPGHCKVTGASVDLKEDQKKAAGKSGGTPSYHGLDTQKFTVEIRVWTDAQREHAETFCKRHVPVAGKPGEPMSIDSPALKHLGIKLVKILGATQWEPAEQFGMLKMTLKVRHWLRASGSSKKSETATPMRAPRNARQEALEKKNPPNPRPSTSATAAAPKR